VPRLLREGEGLNPDRGSAHDRRGAEPRRHGPTIAEVVLRDKRVSQTIDELAGLIRKLPLKIFTIDRFQGCDIWKSLIFQHATSENSKIATENETRFLVDLLDLLAYLRKSCGRIDLISPLQQFSPI
jgi:hypothetical protein